MAKDNIIYNSLITNELVDNSLITNELVDNSLITNSLIESSSIGIEDVLTGIGTIIIEDTFIIG